MSERPRCEKHGLVMVEHFREEGALMIPTGEFACLRCEDEAQGQRPVPSSAETDQ